ncbi:GspH/FimT family pseudopilin [Aporhodopirellula aestuarii]|uniref:General secretion pathway GspH domain-containing protein n=1 Tax=Aporhodopirellula aestuarii TaxID=2950107 RepID=A0ABT0U8H9_9BACT|nr:GspH/FimT family pseudopilin [Aporhodopirellula aestuarii]MCM2373272.1 hypothetical protein [Aporhodopirellula aestuarii]
MMPRYQPHQTRVGNLRPRQLTTCKRVIAATLVVTTGALIGLPNVIAAIRRNRVRMVAKTLRDDLELARRTAMNRGQDVSVYFDWKQCTYHSPDFQPAIASPSDREENTNEFGTNLTRSFGTDLLLRGNFRDESGIRFDQRGSLVTEDHEGVRTSLAVITIQLDGHQSTLQIRPGISLLE